MKAKCPTCGSKYRRIYSIASCDEDDYLVECECVDWDGVFALGCVLTMFVICVLIAIIGSS